MREFTPVYNENNDAKAGQQNEGYQGIKQVITKTLWAEDRPEGSIGLK